MRLFTVEELENSSLTIKDRHKIEDYFFNTSYVASLADYDEIAVNDMQNIA